MMCLSGKQAIVLDEWWATTAFVHVALDNFAFLSTQMSHQPFPSCPSHADTTALNGHRCKTPFLTHQFSCPPLCSCHCSPRHVCLRRCKAVRGPGVGRPVEVWAGIRHTGCQLVSILCIRLKSGGGVGGWGGEGSEGALGVMDGRATGAD